MSLLDKLKTSVDAHNIISFDIFDTLLLRPYVKPTDLFLHLEHMNEIRWFRDNRVRAEQFARELNPTQEEITYDDIYEELSPPFNTLKQAELEWERQVLQPNPEMKEVFDYALGAGKRVIITSDMYLPQSFLQEVLQLKGFSGYEHLFLSSTVKKTKWNGSLYQHIIDELNVSPASILHIGDNRQSDIDMATSLGLDAFLYTKPIERLLKTDVRAAELLRGRENDYQVSILLGVLSIYITQREDNYWKDFGFVYGGPIIHGFMQWLDHQLEQDGIQEAMFVARDGYTPLRVFNIVKTREVRAHYFYAPRIINLVCNLNYQDNARIYGKEAGLGAISLILAYFKEKAPSLQEIIPDIDSYEKGNAFIEKHKGLFSRLAKQECDNWQNYFKQFNIRENNIALIDTCSTLLSAQKALMAGLPEKNIHGYYWFLWEARKNCHNSYQVSSFQPTDKQEFIEWNIMELFMTAPVPPADRLESGEIIFKEPNAQEKRRMEIYPAMSDGMVAYAQFIQNIFGQQRIFSNIWVLIAWTNILCSFPTEKDKTEFRSIQHAWDAVHTQYIPLPAPWFETAIRAPHKRVTRFRLFNALPLLTVRKRENICKYHLFGFAPMMKTIQKGNKRKYRLFGFLPVGSLRERDTSPECRKSSYRILGMSIIKTLRMLMPDRRIRTKVYFLHLKIWTKLSQQF